MEKSFGKYVITLLAAVVALSPVFLQTPSVFSFPSESFVQGLQPDEDMEFRILTSAGENHAVKISADKNGVAVVPEALSRDPSTGFAMETGRFDFSALGDAEVGTISFQARGLAPFSDVEIRNGEDVYKTRADWAGLLSDMDALKLSDAAPDSEVEIAFYGIEDGGKTASPHLIKVQLALVGGGPTADGVNVSSALGCKALGLAGSALKWHKVLDLSNCYPNQHTKQVELIKTNYVSSLMKMTEQLSSLALQQMQVLGALFDADQTIKTQRLFQQLQAQAHKDYQPSEQMCRVGSFTRSLAAADQQAYAAKQALNEVFMARMRNEEGLASARGADEDMQARVDQYKHVYCDPKDNNNGLSGFCSGHGKDHNKMRLNKDVDFTRTAYMPWTLDLDFEKDKPPPDLEDVIALGKNLFGDETFGLSQGGELKDKYKGYMDARQVMAMKNVAYNSYVNYVGMKAAYGAGEGVQGGGAFMKAMMREFGISDEEITVLLGENPSYFAQMQVLTKKMLQHPDFYVNLYDKPTNVQRMEVALQAAQLMKAHDVYDSLLRREMLYAMQIELKLADRLETATAEMEKASENIAPK